MKSLKYIIASLVTALFMFASAKAQQDQTIYLMRDIPQATYSNPSLIPQCKFYIGMPFLSSFYIGTGNNGFTTRDVIRKDGFDSVYVDMNNLSNILRKKNSLQLNYKMELLSFGFKLRRNYFNFSVSENFTGRLTYPGDLFALINEGNGSERFYGKPAVFNGSGLNMTHYREIAVGASRAISEKLVVGFRPKVLFGMSNIHTKKSDISMLTAELAEYIEVSSDIHINTSFPGNNSNPDSIDMDDFDFMDYITNTQNLGFAFDLGGSYQYSDKLIFSMALIDLGWIKWKSHPKNFSSEHPGASIRFEGFDLNTIFSKEDSVNIEQTLSDLGDSLVNTFMIKESFNPYTSWINTKLYLNGVYVLGEKSKAGGLLALDFYNGKVQPSLTLSFNQKFGNIISLTGSYSMKNRNYGNVGFGMALNLGPVQMYFVTDNILSMLYYDKLYYEDDFSVMMPRYSRYMNAHFGINYIFGYKEKDPYIPSL